MLNTFTKKISGGTEKDFKSRSFHGAYNIFRLCHFYSSHILLHNIFQIFFSLNVHSQLFDVIPIPKLHAQFTILSYTTSTVKANIYWTYFGQ